MSILYISDFDLQGSGYMNIGVELCKQLTKKGYDVLALGLGYRGQEHHHPFSIVPATSLQDLAPMVMNLKNGGVDVEAVVVALDIPLQEKLLDQFQAPNAEIPYVGIFPLEAPPVCGPWAVNLLRMDARLVMSKFGERALKEVGVESDFIPIGVDMDAWRVPTMEETAMLRQGLGVTNDRTYVVLTVADNQERKNLSRSMEIFADFSAKRNAMYWLVTRPTSPVGWHLEDFAMRLGMLDKMMVWTRGISFKQLWGLYAAADAMLLTSKAEGLAMPVLEAMSCRLPVVGTKAAAIEEHLEDGRGLLIPPDYVMIDPWGNSERYMAGREDGAYYLRLAYNGLTPADTNAMLDKAQAYVSARTWRKAGNALDRAIKQAQKVKEGQDLYRAAETVEA